MSWILKYVDGGRETPGQKGQVREGRGTGRMCGEASTRCGSVGREEEKEERG